MEYGEVSIVNIRDESIVVLVITTRERRVMEETAKPIVNVGSIRGMVTGRERVVTQRVLRIVTAFGVIRPVTIGQHTIVNCR